MQPWQPHHRSIRQPGRLRAPFATSGSAGTAPRPASSRGRTAVACVRREGARRDGGETEGQLSHSWCGVCPHPPGSGPELLYGVLRVIAKGAATSSGVAGRTVRKTSGRSSGRRVAGSSAPGAPSSAPGRRRPRTPVAPAPLPRRRHSQRRCGSAVSRGSGPIPCGSRALPAPCCYRLPQRALCRPAWC